MAARSWNTVKPYIVKGRAFFGTPTGSTKRANAWQIHKRYEKKGRLNKEGFLNAWMKATGSNKTEAWYVLMDIAFQKWLFSQFNERAKKQGKAKALVWAKAKMSAAGVPVAIQQRMADGLYKVQKKLEKNRGIKGAIKQADKYIKKAGEIAKKSLHAAVKVVGPAIAAIYPAAGPVIQKGLKLLGDAQKGVEGAIKTVKDIKSRAEAGIPGAKQALDTLQAARRLQKQVNGDVPPAPGAVAIDKAKLVQASNQRGYYLLIPRK